MSDELTNRIAELREKHAIVHPTPFIARFCGLDPFGGHCHSCIQPGSKDEDGDYHFAEWPCDVIKALDLLASLRARPQEPGDLKKAIDDLLVKWIYRSPDGDWKLHDIPEHFRDAILLTLAPSGPLSDPDIRTLGPCSDHGVSGCWCSKISRGPLSDEPRELEWDEFDKGYISAGPFIIEQCIAGERRFISLGMDYPFPGEDWDAAKSLAEKLNAVLDGRPLWTEGETK